MNALGYLLSVLFVGNSLFGPTAPQMLQQMLTADGIETRVEAQIINGAPLSYNWQNGAQARGVNARAVLAEGDTDILIMTEAQPLPDQLKWNDTRANALAYYRAAVGANPNAMVFLQETWPQGAGTTAWRQALTDQRPLWQGIVDYVNANAPPGAIPMRLIPAGQAMALLADDIAGGADLPPISDFFTDEIHLSDLGHYYVSLVQYATVTGKSPLGLPHRLTNAWGKPYDAPGAALAERLQALAWRAAAGGGVTKAGAGSQATPARPRQIGIGLAAVNDWSTAQPFLDVMKTARPWIIHRPGRWGGGGELELATLGLLDAQGWPTALSRDLGTIGTVILTDMPEAAVSLAGRYVLRFDGTGVVEVSGRAGNIRYGRGEVRFDYTPGPGLVEIRLQRSAPDDPVRAISVVKETYLARYDAGEVFNPVWLARVGGFDTFRFMDWMETNNSGQAYWADRPQPDDYTYARRGVPVEVMLALMDRTGAAGWFNMPHMADDAYTRAFAKTVRDALGPRARVYAEYSNELWNRQFGQAKWVAAQGLARWGQKDAGAQFHGMRAAQVAAIWRAVFDARPDAPELVNVIATQTGWLGLEEMILNAPLWQADADYPGRPPYSFFDAYAVTAYFGGILGTDGRAPDVLRWIEESRAAGRGLDQAIAKAGQELRNGGVSGNPADTVADLVDRVLPYHAQVAAAYGLDLIAYEGGSHVVGLGAQVDNVDLTAFFHALNASDQMGTLYSELLAGWQRVGGGLFMAYAGVQSPSKWGSWGHLRHLDDSTPRWDVLTCEAGCD